MLCNVVVGHTSLFNFMLMFDDRQVSVRLTHGDNITSTVRGFLEYYFLGEVSADQGFYSPYMTHIFLIPLYVS